MFLSDSTVATRFEQLSVNLGPMTLAWAILLLWQHVLQHGSLANRACTGGGLEERPSNKRPVQPAGREAGESNTAAGAAAAVTTRHERMLPPF